MEIKRSKRITRKYIIDIYEKDLVPRMKSLLGKKSEFNTRITKEMVDLTESRLRELKGKSLKMIIKNRR